MDNIGIPSLMQTNTYKPYSYSSDSDHFMHLNKTLPSIDVIMYILKAKDKQFGYEKKLFILKGLTGSGKSTFFIDALQREFNTNVYCTEPTKLLCEKNFKTQISLFGRKEAVNVGVRTGDYKVSPTGEGHVLFLTIETLNNMINSKDPLLNKVKIIVIDEVHEISSETLICLYTIKIMLNNLNTLSRCPLFILQSATLDVERLANYFAINVHNPLNFAFIEGSTTYPIEMHFVSDKTIKLSQAIATSIVNCVKEEIGANSAKSSDSAISANYKNILIMVNSGRIIEDYIAYVKSDLIKDNIVNLEDILIYYNWVNELSKIDDTKFQILMFELNATNTKSQYSLTTRILEKDHPNLIKIIFSSTVAESGVTIPNVKYCIDSGYSRKTVTLPLVGKDATQLVPETYSSYIQRRGRIGRLSPGKFIGLYDESVISYMQNENPPTLYSSATFISVYINYLKTHNVITNPYLLNNLIDPINVDTMIEGMRKMTLMHIINESGLIDNISSKHLYHANLLTDDYNDFSILLETMFDRMLINYIKSYNFSSFMIALIYNFIKKELTYERDFNYSPTKSIYTLNQNYIVINNKYKVKAYNMAKTIIKYYNVFRASDLEFLNTSLKGEEEKDRFIKLINRSLEDTENKTFSSLFDNNFDEDLTERINSCISNLFKQ